MFVVLLISVVFLWFLVVATPWFWYRWSYRQFASQVEAIERLTKLVSKAKRSVELFCNDYRLNVNYGELEAHQKLLERIRECAKRGVRVTMTIHKEAPASLLSLAREGLVTIERAPRAMHFSLWIIDEKRIWRSTSQAEMFPVGWGIEAPRAYNMAEKLREKLA